MKQEFTFKDFLKLPIFDNANYLYEIHYLGHSFHASSKYSFFDFLFWSHGTFYTIYMSIGKEDNSASLNELTKCDSIEDFHLNNVIYNTQSGELENITFFASNSKEDNFQASGEFDWMNFGVLHIENFVDTKHFGFKIIYPSSTYKCKNSIEFIKHIFPDYKDVEKLEKEIIKRDNVTAELLSNSKK